MNDILILGCGWLGFSLAKNLANQYTVSGTTTQQSKLGIFKKNKIGPILLDINDSGNTDIFLKSLNCKTLILLIPPGNIEKIGMKNLERIITFVSKNETRIIYTSSISVYGKIDGLISEDTKPVPLTKNANCIHEIENMIKTTGNKNYLILRLGGLVGKGRHPIKNLAGKVNVELRNSFVNLVHIDDCLTILAQLIFNSITGTYNFSSLFHPNKKAFYNNISNDYNLLAPKFIETNVGSYKIDSSKIVNKMNFKFEYPNPLKFPIEI